MKVFKHEGHIAYEISKRFVVMRYIGDGKVKFHFPEAKRVKGTRTGFVNIKFWIHLNKQLKYWSWIIRLPFFYWVKDNGGFQIGLPNLYLWGIR